MARANADNMAGSIRALGNGQSYSRTKRFDVSNGPIDTAKALSSLRNLVNSAVSRARNAIDGSDFRVESALGFTSDHKAVLCTVAVTRFDGEAYDDADDYIDEEDVDI